MWNLAKCGVMVVTCMVATKMASATGMPRIDPWKPFVLVKVPEMPLDLGFTYGPGTKLLEGRTVAHVVANCPYHLRASFGGLRHEEGKATVAPEDLSVTINGTPVGKGKSQVAIVVGGGPTPRSGTDIPIEMQVVVKHLGSYPAGRYGGTLVVTIVAGS